MLHQFMKERNHLNVTNVMITVLMKNSETTIPESMDSLITDS